MTASKKANVHRPVANSHSSSQLRLVLCTDTAPRLVGKPAQLSWSQSVGPYIPPSYCQQFQRFVPREIKRFFLKSAMYLRMQIVLKCNDAFSLESRAGDGCWCAEVAKRSSSKMVLPSRMHECTVHMLTNNASNKFGERPCTQDSN